MADRTYALRDLLHLSPRTREGAEAPDVGLALLDGRTLRLSELRGKTVILEFWASHCASCRVALPGLARQWRGLADRDQVVLIAVSFDEDPSICRASIQALGLDEILHARARSAAGDIGEAFGVRSIPQGFVVSPEGRIVSAARYLDLAAL